ncbi:MAG: glycosyltransferase family 4 protein, partial [Bacteroidota bacterium]
MRILLIADGMYPVVNGGMQKHSYYLAKFLAKHQHEVDLAHFVPHGQPLEADQYPALKEIKSGKLRFFPYSIANKDSLPGHYIRENKALSNLVYEDWKDQLDAFDLIYCQGYSAWGFLEAKRKGVSMPPVICNLHGYEMYQKPPSFKTQLALYMLRGITKKVSLESDYVYSYGGKITDIVRQLGVPDEKILEAPLGIESNWLQPSPSPREGRLKFVFIGRNERRKGIQELTQAIQKLLNKASGQFEFHFIGDIEETARINHEQVIYHGLLMGEHLIQPIMRSCDVLVTPSYSEGMPTVIMEGMASGLAVIATDVGAVNKQLVGNGWLLPDSQVETILDALESALSCPEEKLQ